MYGCPVLNTGHWFVASDVARVLGYDHTPHATRLLDDDEADVHKVDTLGGTQEMPTLNQSEQCSEQVSYLLSKLPVLNTGSYLENSQLIDGEFSLPDHTRFKHGDSLIKISSKLRRLTI